MGNILGRQMRDLLVRFDKYVCERLDEVFPLFLGLTVYGFY